MVLKHRTQSEKISAINWKSFDKRPDYLFLLYPNNLYPYTNERS